MEVLISMVIIITITSIVMMILIRISGSFSPAIMTLANQHTKEVIKNIRSSNSLLDEEFRCEGLRIQKSFEIYSGSQDLAAVTISVFDVKDNLILIRKILVEIK